MPQQSGKLMDISIANTNIMDMDFIMIGPGLPIINLTKLRHLMMNL
jgi:hypothetical protein